MKLEVILITVTGEPIGPHDQKANTVYRTHMPLPAL
jgi:hypothetical protein